MGWWKKLFGGGGEKSPEQPAAASPPPRRQTGPIPFPPRRPSGVMTERHLTMTAFGPAQITDNGESRMLRIKEVIPEEFLLGSGVEEAGYEGVIPYLEGDVIVGGYLFDPDKIEAEENRRIVKDAGEKETVVTVKAVLLPLHASIPYFFLNPRHKATVDRIIACLDASGRKLGLPRVEDRTVEVCEALAAAAVASEAGAAGLDLPAFAAGIKSVRSQRGYEEIFQIIQKDDTSYLLCVGRSIPEVLDMFPQLVYIRAHKATHITFKGVENSWLIPLGR